MVLLLAGGAMVVGSASLAAASLRLRSAVSFGLATYLLAWAQVVALTEILSLLRAVSSSGYLAGEAIALMGAATIWHRIDMPRPPLPQPVLVRAVRAHRTIAVLGLVCALALIYEAVVGLSTPPTTLDELWYHLARAAAWLQHGGVYQIPGGNAAMNDYPPNAEIAVLYGFSFLHRETFAALPQLVAQGAVALAIYGLARRLGAPRAGAAFAALLFPTLSMVAIDAMTALNDIVVAAFVAAAAYFIAASRGRSDLALGGLAIGLALGTKYTAFFALPALLLLVVAVLPRARWTVLLASTVISFATVGAYGYLENIVHSHTLLGAGAREIGTATVDVTPQGTISTIARNLYRFGDLPGYRVRTVWLRPIASVGHDVFRALHIPTAPPEASTGGSPFFFDVNVESNTGAAWFGPLGWLLIIPLSLAFGAAWLCRKAGGVHGVLALSLPLYLLATALVYRYTSNGRFFITPIALTLPLAAVLYGNRKLSAPAVVIACATLLFALAYDSDKPTGLGPTRSIWELSRAEAESTGIGPDAAGVIRAVDRLPARENLGFAAAQLYLGYALYGPSLRRRLIPLSVENPLADADRLGLRAVYLGPDVSKPTRALGWTAKRYGGAGTFLTRGDAGGG